MSYNQIQKGDRLRLYRETLRLNQVEFAEKYHSNQKSISRYETGLSEIPAELEYSLIQDGINLNWLFTGNGEMMGSNGYEIPLLTMDKALKFDPEKEIPDPKAHSGEYPKASTIFVPLRILSYSTDLRAIVVFNNHMAPLFHTGDIVLFEATGWNGEGIYLYQMGGKLYISHITRKGNSIILTMAKNKSIPCDYLTFKPIGRIVSVVKDLIWGYTK
ncbi:MAG: helix-turn-helix domain-containing protein [Spirochaetaceae bacterium]|nr:helix-turn-helix domain-containing protein [Spirochaetaceae bacterium]